MAPSLGISCITSTKLRLVSQARVGPGNYETGVPATKIRQFNLYHDFLNCPITIAVNYQVIHLSLVVSSPATPPKNRRGESLGALAKFLGCADVAFSIPELPIRSTRRAFT